MLQRLDRGCGCGRKEAALTCGPGRSATGGEREARRQLLQRWAGAELGWRGAGPEMRRRGETGDRCWAGPAWDATGRPSQDGASARAENRGGEKRKNFPFSFSKQIFQKHFKFKFQFSLRFLINTNIHKLICSSMYASLVANLIFDFCFIKIITFLCLNAHINCLNK